MLKTINKIICVVVLFTATGDAVRKESLTYGGDLLRSFAPEIYDYVISYGDIGSVQDLMVQYPLEDIHSQRLRIRQLVGLAIFIAAIRNDTAKLQEWLLEMRPGWDSYLGQALAIAAQSGQEETVELLIEAARLSERFRQIITWRNQEALRLARENGHRYIVALLLTASNSPEALPYAAEHGFIGLVKELVRKRRTRNRPQGIDVNLNDGQALRMAAQAGHTEIVSLLQQAGARPQIPLQWAIRNNQFETVASMIELGIPVTDDMLLQASQGQDSDIMQLLIKKGANLHAQEDKILQQAVERGNYRIVHMLIELVEDENSTIEPFDKNILLKLIERANELRQNPPGSGTGQFYARITNELTQYIERMESLVHAAASGLEEETQLLLHGKNIHWNHEEALREAIKNRHDSVVQLLLQAGADSERALVWAAQHGDISLVTKLVKSGAKNYDDALIAATTNGHPGIVELLVEHNPNLHAGEDSSIRAAVEQGDDYIVALLIGLAEDHPENIPPFDRVLLNDLIARALILRSAPPAGRTEQNFTDIIATLRDYIHRIYEQEVSEHPTKRRRGGLSTI